MGKARAYVFLTALGIAGILFLFNANIPQKKESGAVTNISAWGGGAEPRLSISYSVLPRAKVSEGSKGLDQAKIIPPIFSYKIPSANVSRGAVSQEVAPRPPGADDENTTLASSPSKQAVQTSPMFFNTLFDNAYLFIPTGSISTSISQTPAKTRTPEEKSYFDYGNAVGLEIRAFDNSHKETTAILDAFFKDYKNQSKVAALLAVAHDYERLASDLSAIENVPKELSEEHSSLLLGYVAISRGLIQLTKEENDKEMADAVLAYDASAEEFIKKFISIAEFFSARGIKFSDSDPGVIFQFNN